MIKLIVTGAAGRMGNRIISLALVDKSFKLVGAVESKESSVIGIDAGEVAGLARCGVKVSNSLDDVMPIGDVVIDFTNAEATLANLNIVSKYKKAAVVGTTGHTPSQRQGIEKLASSMPLVFAPNMSVGVNVLWKILGEAAKILGTSYPVNVKEVHHIHKKDKPSGTALEIVRVLSKALSVSAEKIPVMSLREGEVVGDHTTLFAGVGETLEITHRASSRDPFALGALRAAKWVVGKPKGLYSMTDVLGLE